VIEAKRTDARLDEASARRIAAGRIALIERRIAAAPHGPLPSKPNARVARMTAWLEAGCGDWLLDVYQEGRKTFYLMALPGEPKGWIDLAVYRYNARSDALEEIALRPESRRTPRRGCSNTGTTWTWSAFSARSSSIATGRGLSMRPAKPAWCWRRRTASFDSSATATTD